MHRSLVVVLTLSVAAWTDRPAAAQSSTVEAEQLFREGKRFMKEQRFAEACEAFETSNKLDESLATRLNLADCREKNQQLATAWGLFVDAERATRGDAKHKALNKTAKDRAAAIEPRLSYLTVSVPDESRVDDLSIRRNGAQLDEGLWNRAVPVDGGAIVITASAPGHEEWSTTITVQPEHGRVSVEVPKFKDLKAMTPPAGDSATTSAGDGQVSSGLDRPTRERAESGQVSGRRKTGLAVGAFGVAALGAGVWLGLSARGLNDDAFALCPDPAVPCAAAEEATELSERAHTRALIANGAFAAAAVATGTAVYLWITGKTEWRAATTSVSTAFTPSFTGVVIEGVFP